jgi:hypothetical protein
MMLFKPRVLACRVVLDGWSGSCIWTCDPKNEERNVRRARDLAYGPANVFSDRNEWDTHVEIGQCPAMECVMLSTITG